MIIEDISFNNEKSFNAHINEFIDSLDKATVLTMFYTLQQKGVFVSSNEKFDLDTIVDRLCSSSSSRFRNIILRWLNILEKYNLIKKSDNRYYTEKKFLLNENDIDLEWNKLSKFVIKGICPKLVLEYFKKNAMLLRKMLKEEYNPTWILFPEGKVDYANSLYCDFIIAKYLNIEVANKIEELIKEKGKNINILEVGAGIGATSKVVINKINNDMYFNGKYIFSDISRFFLNYSKKNYNKYPFIEFKDINIDNDIVKQGIEEESIDIIIAAGVLNNAKDMTYTFENFRKVLKNEGYLIVTEGTNEIPVMLISQVFMMERPNDERNLTNSTFLSISQWEAIFGKEGFNLEKILPTNESPLSKFGQNAFFTKKRNENFSSTI